jgi:hypothetical protein
MEFILLESTLILKVDILLFANSGICINLLFYILSINDFIFFNSWKSLEKGFISSNWFDSKLMVRLSHDGFAKDSKILI